MKAAYLVGCVIIGGLLGANFATADRPVDTAEPAQPDSAMAPGVVSWAPKLCPLWPIGWMEDGTLIFFAEHYDSNSYCIDPSVGWWAGEAPDWPYFCPDCFMGSWHVAGQSKAQEFRGLEKKVDLDFRPTFPEQLRANAGVSFLGEEFVEFTVPETQKVHRAKLFRIKLSPSAAGRSKGGERIIGLGYEVEGQAPSMSTLAARDANVTSVNGSAYGCRVNVGSQQYLVILAR
jgi:hypothetical protein